MNADKQDLNQTNENAAADAVSAPQDPAPTNTDAIATAAAQDAKASEKKPAIAAGPDKGRFSLDDAGQVLWQKDSSNPLPGIVVASLAKGENAFDPQIVAVQSDYPENDKVAEDVKNWLVSHIDDVLGGIVRFAGAEGVAAPLQDIARTLKSHLGVVDRYKLERSLGELDPDMRRILRQHKVRSGPLLVFYQDLLKPAPLKLKSILWAVYHERELPLKRPKDGIVSEVLTDERIDYPYYRMLGYPVYAGRAIRIDMLDRVVTDIYDQAKDGTFHAQHKYAEWLGCSVDALYTVLEALGHFKVSESKTDEPATQAQTDAKDSTEDAPESAIEKGDTPTDTAVADAPEKAAEPKAEAVAVEVKVATEAAETATVQPDAKDENKSAAPVKPVLALFKLKKGKLSTAPKSHTQTKKPSAAQDKTKSFTNNQGKDSYNPKENKSKFKGKKQKPKKQEGPRVIKIEAQNQSDDDNPFAVLKNLKLK